MVHGGRRALPALGALIRGTLALGGAAGKGRGRGPALAARPPSQGPSIRTASRTRRPTRSRRGRSAATTPSAYGAPGGERVAGSLRPSAASAVGPGFPTQTRAPPAA